LPPAAYWISVSEEDKASYMWSIFFSPWVLPKFRTFEMYLTCMVARNIIHLQTKFHIVTSNFHQTESSIYIQHDTMFVFYIIQIRNFNKSCILLYGFTT
jgi:hypothetical protein